MPREDADEIVVLGDEEDDEDMASEGLLQASDEESKSGNAGVDEGEAKSPESPVPRNSRDEEEAKLPLRQNSSRRRSSARPDEDVEGVADATRFVDVAHVAQSVAERSIAGHLEGRSFRPADVPRWVEAVSQQCVDDLSAACGNLKYIASAVVYESARGAGMDASSSMFWNADADDAVTVSWDNDSIGCIVTIFGVSF